MVSFAAGSKDVFVSYPSSRAVYQNEAGTQTVQSAFGAITATSVAMTTGTITTAPVNNTDIVNKQYADAIASGIHFHEAVDLATTAALPANTYNNGASGVGATLTATANGALSVDSTLTVAGNRILVKNQAAGLQNGVYVVTQVGSAGTPYILTRATDFDSVGTGVDQIDEGDFFLVTSGTANVNTAWVQQTPPPITLGTTAIVFQQFSAPITYTAGTGLSESPTYTFNIANTGTAGTYGSASAVPVFVTNAQGQVTSVTNTAIAINGSAVSGNITGQAGSVANALTAGSFLTSGGTYNGSAARTFAVDATDANTASKVVARDASGNFSAGTITAALSGNATSATNVAGGAANRIVFNTGAGATSFVVAPSASGQVLSWNGSAFTYVAGTISGVALGSNLNSLTAGTYLTGTAYNGSGAQTWTVDATDANTASKVVARDASGNFSAGTITATLSGNATTATTATTATNQSGGTVNATTIVASTSIYPAADNTGVIGDAANTWSNGQFTNLTVDSTLTVRSAIDLADSDILRFGTSDDTQFFYDGTNNTMEMELEAAAVSFIITDNGTTRFTFTKTTGDLAATSFTGAGTGLTGTAAALSIGGNAATATTATTATNATNVTGTVAIANGGTGSTTSTGALTNLGALPLAGGTMTGALGLPNAGYLTGSNAFEKLIGVSFPNGTANLAADIRFGNLSFWGYIEVEITGSFSNQNSAGKLTKLFAVGTNPNNLIYNNVSRVADVMGTISDNITIGDFAWDATNTTYRIPISHIVSSGNDYTIKVRMFTHGGGAGAVFPGLAMSANYTLTALPAHTAATYNGNLLINGTSQVLSAGNFNTYAPTLTGTGASGTWGISISGNAATATTATNVATTATATNANFFIPFVAASTTGNQALGVDAGITYNPFTDALTSAVNGGTF